MPVFDHQRLQRDAREHLGYRLTPEQEEAVVHVVSRHDTLVVMPTAAGKSAIYRLAARELPGPIVVVSPLIALQAHQASGIEEQDVGAVEVLNSTHGNRAREQALRQAAAGDLEFIVLSPEQLANGDTRTKLRAAHPSLFVVDEAHCISESGHDFRPDYLTLGAVIDDLGHPVVLAMTATATAPVRDEIIARLHMCAPDTVAGGFDRPEIWLGARRCEHPGSKDDALVGAICERHPPGIVYVATRKHAESVTRRLRAERMDAAAYHAGMRPKERESVQQRFLDGRLPIVVATNAFGLGIDKPDVRFVMHYDIPGSIDEYYQEFGRAGRDGNPAAALLFYYPGDLRLRRFFAGQSEVSEDEAALILHALEPRAMVTIAALHERTGLSRSKLAAALNRLEEAGSVRHLPGDEIEVASDVARDDLAQRIAEAQEHRREFEQSRVEMMRRYAEERRCRREFLLNYFGEPYRGPCGNCDNCDAGAGAAAAEEEPFALGARVRHRRWGEGTVQHYANDTMTVLFDSAGYRRLLVRAVVEGELLEPASADSVDR